jgi:transposase-like protein
VFQRGILKVSDISFWMISNEIFALYVSDERRLIGNLLDRGILYSTWRCEFGLDHTINLETMCFRCLCGQVDHRRSVFVGSFFDHSRLPLRTVLSIGFEWVSETPARVAASRLAIGHSTVLRYYAYYRQAAEASLRYAPVRIGGPGVEVVIDEMVTSRRDRQGRPVWVLGAVERTPQRLIFLAPLRSHSAAEFTRTLRRCLVGGSVMVTDLHRSYPVAARRLQLRHLQVHRDRDHRNRLACVTTNEIEGTWPGFRRFIDRRRRVATGTICAEFMWRRLHQEDLWEGLLRTLAEMDWTTGGNRD